MARSRCTVRTLRQSENHAASSTESLPLRRVREILSCTLLRDRRTIRESGRLCRVVVVRDRQEICRRRIRSESYARLGNKASRAVQLADSQPARLLPQRTIAAVVCDSYHRGSHRSHARRHVDVRNSPHYTEHSGHSDHRPEVGWQCIVGHDHPIPAGVVRCSMGKCTPMRQVAGNSDIQWRPLQEAALYSSCRLLSQRRGQMHSPRIEIVRVLWSR